METIEAIIKLHKIFKTNNWLKEMLMNLCSIIFPPVLVTSHIRERPSQPLVSRRGLVFDLPTQLS